jgi:hypothetical protein
MGKQTIASEIDRGYVRMNILQQDAYSASKTGAPGISVAGTVPRCAEAKTRREVCLQGCRYLAQHGLHSFQGGCSISPAMGTRSGLRSRSSILAAPKTVSSRSSLPTGARTTTTVVRSPELAVSGVEESYRLDRPAGNGSIQSPAAQVTGWMESRRRAPLSRLSLV